MFRTQFLRRRRAPRAAIILSLLVLLAGLFARPASAQPTLPAPASAPAAVPAADPASVTFMRDLLGAGQITPGDDWTIGGGYLYWARCQQIIGGVPQSTEAQPSAGATGYLRRWPIRGGAVATLSSAAFCNTNSWAADDSGLYYGNGTSILRRSTSNPFAVETIFASSMPSEPIILNNGTTIWRDYIFWLANNTLYGAHRYTHRQFAAPEPLGANAHSVLFANDNHFYWFADGVLYSALKPCLAFGGGTCIKDVVASENGNNLTDATLTSSFASSSTFPLWTNGASIRGIWCRFNSTGRVCSPSASYTSPVPNSSLGSLATDGQFLFWVENTADVCGGPFACSFGDHGRLMKWSLKHSTFSPGPFDTPQPIASQNSAGAFSISGSPGVVAVADGWVYFDTSNGLSRIRADAPPISWDLSFKDWEITQGIQNLANDVPLVANKPTFVRAYGTKFSGPSAFSVEAILSGTAGNGAALGTLRSINGSQNFATNNGTPDRANAQGGWLFQLPDSWTSAGVTKLTLRIDPRGVWNDPNRGNNVTSIQPFSFTRKAPVCIVTIPVRTHAPAASNTDPSLFRMADVTRQMLPTNDVWLFHQDDDVAELEARFGIPPWKYGPYEIPDDGSKVLRSLWLRDAFSDDPDQCDDSGATTHYVGLVSAATNTDNNLGLGNRPGANLYTKLINQTILDTTPLFWQQQAFNTLAHELSHNYGRQHVNCGGPANPDPGYPYRDANGTNCVLDDGLRGGPLFPIPAYNRYYGFDTQSLTPIDPGTTADYMAYRAPFWISDYTWRALFGSINTNAIKSSQQERNGTTQTQAEIAAATNVVYISGAVDPAASSGSLDYAWVYPSASMSQGIRAKLQRNAAPRAATVATRDAGTYTLRLRDAAGTLLDERAITLQDTSDGDGTTQSFVMTFPAPAAPVATLELVSGDAVIATLQPGGDAPTVSILSPAGGETIDNQMTLSWNGSDPNAEDKLLFSVQYSPDSGAHWRTMLSGFPNRSGTDTVTLNLDELTGIPASTTGGLIRVAASDGYNTTLSTSQPFTVVNRAPVPIINAPGSTPLPAGQTIVLHGSATDVEDGGLSGDSLRWALDGADSGNGQTQTIEGLAPGSHTLTLTASDAAGKQATATQTLTVAPLVIPQAAPVFDGDCNDDAYANAARIPLAPYADGMQAFVTLARTDAALYACFAGMKRTGGSSPGTLALVRVDSDYGRRSAPGANDRAFYTDEAGVVTTFKGDGTTYVAGDGGVSAQISANATSWNAELRIDASVVGGMNHVIGLDVEQALVDANSGRYPWPQRAAYLDPSTWGAAALGDLPQISDVTPASAPVGAGDTTITVNGSGFAAGATVQFNGTALATTVISDTQLQATIPVASLGTVGMFNITAVNPGLEAAPSNALPFSVTNPVPQLSQARLNGTTLTLTGSSFAAGATVQFNGNDYPASGAGAQISVTVSDADLIGSDGAPVTVYNPGPGGGVSNVVTLGAAPVGGARLYLPILER